MIVDVGDVERTLAVDRHRWVLTGVGAVVEDGFRPRTVPPVHQRKTVRAGARIVVGENDGHFALFTRVNAEPVVAAAVDEAAREGGGRVADT